MDDFSFKKHAFLLDIIQTLRAFRRPQHKRLRGQEAKRLGEANRLGKAKMLSEAKRLRGICWEPFGTFLEPLQNSSRTSRRVLGASWEPLGSLLEACRKLLEDSWTLLELIWEFWRTQKDSFGLSWGLVDASWGRLERSWEIPPYWVWEGFGLTDRGGGRGPERPFWHQDQGRHDMTRLDLARTA